MNLNGRSVLISGGAGALGRAAAARAAALGARVVLFDRQFDAALRAAYDCHALDLSDGAAVAAAVPPLGDIDVLFNIAGGFDMGAAADAADDAQWQAMFALNVATLRNLVKTVLPGMRARWRGSVVNVGALSALHGKAQMSAYTASKAVVMNLTESLAAECAGSGVRVNAVLPSIIDTPANRAAMPGANVAEWVSPAAIADVMCFLASDAARAINGALIPVGNGQGSA